MPTGYTCNVVDGKVTEFKDFALQCARAFGALITMRDDSFDAPIPDEIKPETDYYDKHIAADMKRMGVIQAMTNAEADVAAAIEHQEALQGRATYLATKDAEAARLNAMLAKVRAWEPPTPDHADIKRFMIDQLTISMPGQYTPSIPVMLDGVTWRKQRLDDLAASVVRNKQEREKEIERSSKRTEWIKNLRASLA